MEKQFMKLLKVLPLSVLALSLVACGGGSDGDSGSGSNNGGTGGNTGGSTNYVAGQFKDAVSTGEKFYKLDPSNNLPDYEFGSMSAACKDTNKYFESENTMVYGAASISEDYFKKAATVVENNLQSAVSAMGYTISEFNQERMNLAKFAVNNAVQAMGQMDFYGKPDNFSSMSYEDQQKWSYQHLRSSSRQDRIAFALQAAEYNGVSYTEQEVIYKDKIIVCLKESTSTYNLGEGHRVGLSMAVPALFDNKNYEQLVKHELIHTVQKGIIAGLDGSVLPRWFSEGQAVYLSGQELASQNELDTFYIPDYVYSSNEGSDSSELYKHYGAAYKFLVDANTSSSMKQIVNGTAENIYPFMYQSELPEDYEYSYYDLAGQDTEAASFVMGWDSAKLKMKNGAELKFIEWKNHYNTVVNTQ